MRGTHPDVIFSEARLRMVQEPYVQAMIKHRDAHPERMSSKSRRAALLASPARYGLSDAEIDAVRAIAERA